MTKDIFEKASQLQHDVEVMSRMEYIIDETVKNLNDLRGYTALQYDVENGSKETLDRIEKYSKSIGELFEALIHDCPNVGISMTVEVLQQLRTLASKQKETMTEDFKQL
jgi:hypothetical protein